MRRAAPPRAAAPRAANPPQQDANTPVNSRRRSAPTLQAMNENSGLPDPVNSMEATLAVRKAHRDAESQASDLDNRLAAVDLHQREARYLLERAAMLERRRRRAP